MGTNMSANVLVRLPCPHCGKTFEELLTRLVMKNSIACPSSECGLTINLEAGDNGLRIQKLAQACSEIDVAISKTGKLG